jgi:hypothetical protein
MNYFSNFTHKSVCSLFALVLLVSISNAQTGIVKAYPKVIDAIGADHVSFLEKQYPDSIMFYNFLLENSFKVLKKENFSSTIDYKTLEEIKISDSWIIKRSVDFKKFNVLMVSAKPDPTKDKYYKIAETDNILLLKSSEYNRKKFEGYKSFQK